MISASHFERERRLQLRFERVLDGRLRCPVCWKLRTRAEFTREHVPPKAVHRMTGERYVRGLVTCEKCNNTIGAQAQNDLLGLLRFQRFVHRAGDYVAGELTSPGVNGTMRVKVRWALGGKVSIVGIPEQNNPVVVQQMTAAITGGRKATLEITHRFHYPERALRGVIHAAYLVLVARTQYRYAYAPAGKFSRSLLDGEPTSAANYCLAARTLPVGGPVAVARLERPKRLAGYLVKVAGQLIPMPFEGTSGRKYYERWWKYAHVDRYRSVLVPHVRSLKLTIDAEEMDVLPYMPIKIKRASLVVQLANDRGESGV